MATLESKLILSLVDEVTAPARKVEQRMRGLNDRIAKNNRQVAQATGRFARAGAAAVGLGAALSAPARTAGNFEEAMANVRKVVDFETPEQFQKMRADILELSKVLPLSVEGIAAIAESAGSFGLRGADIIKFTEAAAKIGVAFDISADQAGEAMKKIMTGLDLNVDGATNLFNKINVLSNNQAATANEILDVVRQVGADAKGFGFAADETAAFASAMVAAGGKVSTAGTTFRNVGKALSRGASATGRQKDAFTALGLEATDVAKRMQDDAVGTTIDVLERINQLPAEMQSAVQSDLFGDEARDLSKIRQNMDVVREGLRLTKDEAAAAGSVQEEFDVRAATLNAKAQLLKNSFDRLNIAIGNTFMKSLKGAMERIGRIADAVARWAEENPKLASGLIKATGALVAFNLAFAGVKLVRLLLWGGALRTAAAGLRVFGAASAFVKGSAGSALALDAALAGMEGRSPGKIRKIGVALKAVAGATGLGRVARWLRKIADITGLTAVGRGIRAVARATGLVKVPKGIGLLARGLGKIAGVAAKLTGLKLVASGLSAVIGVIGTISAPAWVPVVAAIAAFGAAWKYWDRITAIVSGVASAISEELQPVVDWIKEKLEPLAPILEPIGKAFAVLGEGISAAFSAIRDFFTGDIFKREKLGEEEFASIEEKAKAAAQTIINSVKDAFNDFIDWVAGIPGRIIDALGSIDLGDMINFPEPPKWLRWLMGEEEVAAPPVPTPTDIAGQAAEAGQTPAQRAAQIVNRSDTLPSLDDMTAMREEASGLRAEIAAIQREIEATQPGRGGDARIARLREDMAPLKARLEEVEGELENARQRAGELQSALEILSQVNASPEIQDASIQRALEKAERLRSELSAINKTASANAPAPVDGERAGGGPVRRGRSYLVGERGPEIITPQRSGFVHTARETVRLRERIERDTARASGRQSTIGRAGRAAAAAAGLGVAAAAPLAALPNINVQSPAVSLAPSIAAGAAGAAGLPGVVGLPGAAGAAGLPGAAGAARTSFITIPQPTAAPIPQAAPSPVSTVAGQAAPSQAPAQATSPAGPANITFGDIIVQGGSNASAEELGQEFGRQVAARMRSQFSDEF